MLIKRYRQLDGELWYCKRRVQGPVEGLALLEHAMTVLAETLKALNPDFDISALKPIPFRPPEILSHQALTRAVLATLRVSNSPLSQSALYDALLLHSKLGDIDGSQEKRLRLRIQRLTASLKDGISSGKKMADGAFIRNELRNLASACYLANTSSNRLKAAF